MDLDQVQLTLYTYTPKSASTGTSQPSPLPSSSRHTVPSQVSFAYAALPWSVRPGDYVEIRRPRRRAGLLANQATDRNKAEATKGVLRDSGRDGYVFMVGEDVPNVPLNQIQVPESIAASYKLQHRLEVDVFRVGRQKFWVGLILDI